MPRIEENVNQEKTTVKFDPTNLPIIVQKNPLGTNQPTA